MTENEFQNVININKIDMQRDDVQKIIDRFLNSVDGSIDTNIILKKMFIEREKIEDGDHNGASTFRAIVNQPILNKIARKLEKRHLSNKVIRVLKRKDPDKTEYLTFEQIKDGFHSVGFKLSTLQVTEMLSDIKTNKYKQYNYHILLSALFGNDYETVINIPSTPSSSKNILKSDKKKSKFSKNTRLSDVSDSGRSDRSYQRHSRSRGNGSKLSKDDKSRTKSRKDRRSSNKDFDRSRTRYDKDHKYSDRINSKNDKERRAKSRPEHLIRKDDKSMHREDRSVPRDRQSRHHDDKSRSKGRDKSKTPLGKQAKELGKLLEASHYDYIDNLKQYAGDDIEYFLTDTQIFKMLDNAHIRLNKYEKEDLIRDLGDTRFTVEEFLINCRLDLNAFQNDYEFKNKITLSNEEKEMVTNILKDIGLAIEDHKKEFEQIFNLGPFDKKLDFTDFKYALEIELGDDIARIAEDPKSMTLLRNFLLYDAEYDQKIKVKFLYSTLFPAGDDKPEPKSKINCITDFIEFLEKTPEMDIDKEFKGGVPHESFEKILDSHDYKITHDNLEKLKSAFTDPKEPNTISLTMIKRNINLLAPSFLNKDAKADRKEISDKLSHVDPKVK